LNLQNASLDPTGEFHYQDCSLLNVLPLDRLSLVHLGLFHLFVNCATGQQVRSSSLGVVPTTWTEFGARVCSSTLGDNTWQRQLWTSDYLHDWYWLYTAWKTHHWHFQYQVHIFA